jgi:hypothetical protein
MQDARQENPNLVAFLEERLPQLGLDGETYGGYVLGVNDTDDIRDEDDDDDDDANSELANVIQLLQASSEEYGDDDAVWEQLAADIQAKLQLDSELKAQTQAQQRQHQKALLEEQLAKAKLEQQDPQAKKKSTTTTGSAVDEATKQAMLSRFAYDEDTDAAADATATGGKKSHAAADTSSETPGVLTNKQLAAQVNLEKANAMKAQKGQQTKKEAQQQTKEQKASKVQLKEERRKKTVKGERKR